MPSFVVSRITSNLDGTRSQKCNYGNNAQRKLAKKTLFYIISITNLTKNEPNRRTLNLFDISTSSYLKHHFRPIQHLDLANSMLLLLLTFYFRILRCNVGTGYYFDVDDKNMRGLM